MRTFLLLVLVLIAGVFNPVSAQSEPTPQALVGTWTASAKHPSGATITANVALKADMQFVGIVAVDGKLAWNTRARGR